MLADLFARRHDTDLLVVDTSLRLLGVVRDHRVARAVLEASAHDSPRDFEGASRMTPLDRTAGELMALPNSVPESVSVREALFRMARSHLRSIPVITGEGVPLGILSDIDALDAFARSRKRR